MNSDSGIAMALKLLCRLCAKQDQSCVDVFGERGKQYELEEKIRMCLPISVNEDDVLPRQICLQCLKRLETSFDFYSESLKAEMTIKKMLEAKEDETSLESCISSKNGTTRSLSSDTVLNKMTTGSTLQACNHSSSVDTGAELKGPVEYNKKDDKNGCTRECPVVKLHDDEGPLPRNPSSTDASAIVMDGEHVPNVKSGVDIDVPIITENLMSTHDPDIHTIEDGGNKSTTVLECQKEQSTVVNSHNHLSSTKEQIHGSCKLGIGARAEKVAIEVNVDDDDDVKFIVQEEAAIEVLSGADNENATSRCRKRKSVNRGRMGGSIVNSHLSSAEGLPLESTRPIHTSNIIEIEDEDMEVGENAFSTENISDVVNAVDQSVPKDKTIRVNDEQTRRSSVVKSHNHLSSARERERLLKQQRHKSNSIETSAIIEIDEEGMKSVGGVNEASKQHLTDASASSSLCTVEQGDRTTVNNEQEVRNSVVNIHNHLSSTGIEPQKHRLSAGGLDTNGIVEIDKNDEHMHICLGESRENKTTTNHEQRIKTGVVPLQNNVLNVEEPPLKKHKQNMVIEIDEDDEDDVIATSAPMETPSHSSLKRPHSRNDSAVTDPPARDDSQSTSTQPSDGSPEVEIKEDLVKCEFCFRDFPPNTLIVHRVLHFRERFFTCLDCGKNFFTVIGLEGHRCGVIDEMIPLLQFCRRAILRQMGKSQLKERIMSLELPHTLKDYLLYPNRR